MRSGRPRGFWRRIMAAELFGAIILALATAAGAVANLIPVGWLWLMGCLVFVLTLVGTLRPGQISSTKQSSAVSRAQPINQMWSIPHVSSEFFARDADTAQLDDLLTDRARTVVLHGLGGVGKSQLAIRYADLLRERGKISAGWWIDARTPATVSEGIARLASALGIPQTDDINIGAANVVAELSCRDHWILIFDDATDASVINTLRPTGSSGYVVITSRNPNWSGIAKPKLVEPFSLETATEFLVYRTADADYEAARGLAVRLGGLPLALEQAASYCRRGDTLSIRLASYLSMYDKAPTKMLRTNLSGPQGETVARTWTLGIRAAARRNPASLPLLVLLSYLAPVALPISVLIVGSQRLPRQLSLYTTDEVELSGLLDILCDMSLVKLVEGQIAMHQLVQEVTRSGVSGHGHETRRGMSRPYRKANFIPVNVLGRSRRWPERRWLEAALDLVCHAFPTGGHTADRWELCAALRPHADVLLAHASAINPDPLLVANLQVHLAYYLDDRGDYAAARPLLEASLATRQRILGDTHPDTLASANNLGTLLRAQADYAAACDLHKNTFATLEKIHGDKHPDTLASMNNLALALRDLNELPAARELSEKALAIRAATLGDRNPDTLNSMNDLANLMRAQGDLAAARDLHVKNLEISEQVLGRNHPDTIGVLSNLAITLAELGDLELAAEYQEQALSRFLDVLGEFHPDTLTVMSNLASVSAARGDIDLAVELLERVVSERGLRLGMGHPDTLAAAAELSTAKRHEHDGAMRMDIHQREIDTCRRITPE